MGPVIWFALAAVFCGLAAVLLAAGRKRRAAKRQTAADAPAPPGSRQERSALEGVPAYFGLDDEDDRRAADADWDAASDESGDGGANGGGD